MPVDEPHLSWTGHPIVDMGVATITAFAERDVPGDVSVDDLDDFASYVERALRAPAVRSHASVPFTINVPYLQPSFTQQTRDARARTLLHAFNATPVVDGPPCAYCGRPGLKLETTSGRAYRELIPLLTGQGIVNFAPYGQHGLSLCGLCLLSFQALIIGAPSCEGRALIISADDPSQLVSLIKGSDWLGAVRSRIELSLALGQKVDTWKAPRTRLVDRLVRLEEAYQLSSVPCSFTIYHASNSGQGPTIDVHHLSSRVATFIKRARGALHEPAWGAVVARQWRDEKRRLAEREPSGDERVYWRNGVYEDVFLLPDQATRFIRRHFVAPELRAVRQRAVADRVPLWGLIELFLEEVLRMDSVRIESIRELADSLADEIRANNDKPLFGRVFSARSYFTIRKILISASTRRIKRGDSPVASFDGFLSAFEEGEDLPRSDWRLAWDLILMRVIDQLYAEPNWFHANPDAADVISEAVDPGDSTENESLPVSA